MCPNDEDDKPTVVLDLNALKKQKQIQDEDLAKTTEALEFNVPVEGTGEVRFAHLDDSQKLPVILFDFQSSYFEENLSSLPGDYHYQVIKELPELNQILKTKEPHLLLFNYDVNPKAINQLSAQVKQKFPHIKTIIMAKNISSEKARLHAESQAGASGYFQLPLEESKVRKVFEKILQNLFQAS